MFRVRKITSLDLPELQPYRTMRRPMEHREQGIFVAEGEKVVRRLLQSNFPVVSVLLPEKWVADYEPLIEARPEKDIPVFVVTEKNLLEQLVGFSMYQGVLAVGKIPARPTLEQVLNQSAGPRLFVAVDGLTSAENLGAVVRNCVAFGAQAIIVSETSSSPYLRRAVRNSMGTIFQLPVVETPSLLQSLATLRANNIHCIAAHPHVSGKTIADANFKTDSCIIFGSEGHGISPAVLQLCDDAVAIPMSSDVDSLNVGAAAAVFLYETARQRGKT
jgi:tRNA G18 (ribose-2'-O)-methylase SpoU